MVNTPLGVRIIKWLKIKECVVCLQKGEHDFYYCARNNQWEGGVQTLEKPRGCTCVKADGNGVIIESVSILCQSCSSNNNTNSNNNNSAFRPIDAPYLAIVAI